MFRRSKSYYDVLGIAADADEAAIQRAVRHALKENHPDYGGNTADLQLVMRARDTLLHQGKRASYDTMLRRERSLTGGIARRARRLVSKGDQPIQERSARAIRRFSQRAMAPTRGLKAAVWLAFIYSAMLLTTFLYVLALPVLTCWAIWTNWQWSQSANQ
jgi:DnaJ-class molecular chaperone